MFGGTDGLTVQLTDLLVKPTLRTLIIKEDVMVNIPVKFPQTGNKVFIFIVKVSMS